MTLLPKKLFLKLGFSAFLPTLFLASAFLLHTTIGLWFECYRIILLLFALAGLIFTSRIIAQSIFPKKIKGWSFLGMVALLAIQVALGLWVALPS